MARGWESKGVEQQQAENLGSSQPEKHAITREEADVSRRREGLLLRRKHVLKQLEAIHHERHRAMLETALAELDSQLQNIKLEKS